MAYCSLFNLAASAVISPTPPASFFASLVAGGRLFGDEPQGLRIAAFMAAVLGTVTLLLMAATLVLRVRLIFSARRQARFLAIWRPLLMEALWSEPILPPIAQVEWPLFLVLWNHLHESLRGDAKERLNDVGRRVGLGASATRFLRSSAVRRKLMGVLALGNLRWNDAWPELESLVPLSNPYLSVAAMRSLVQIDGERAAPLLVREIARRDDWAANRVATLLNETAAAVYMGPVIAALARLPDEQVVRLLRYLEHVKAPEASAAMTGVLAGNNIEVLAAALPLAGPRDLARVRELLADTSWVVRTQAAAALGRLGMRGDEVLLTRALEDGEWWVRYRAAHALLNLPFIDSETLVAIKSKQKAALARDMIDHVMAERGIR